MKLKVSKKKLEESFKKRLVAIDAELKEREAARKKAEDEYDAKIKALPAEIKAWSDKLSAITDINELKAALGASRYNSEHIISGCPRLPWRYNYPYDDTALKSEKAGIENIVRKLELVTDKDLLLDERDDYLRYV